MMWIWSYPVSKREFLLKLGAPKKQAKSFKTVCEKLLLHWQAIGLKLYSQVFPKVLAKLAYHPIVHAIVKNLLTQAFGNFYHNLYITHLPLSFLKL